MTTTSLAAAQSSTRSLARRVASAAAAILLYLLVFAWFSGFGLVSRSAIVLSILPIVVIADGFGIWGGLTASLAAVPLNLLLLRLFAVEPFSEAFARDFAVTHLTFVLLGIVLGYMRHVRRKLEEELRERERTEQALQQKSRQQQQLIETARYLTESLEVEEVLSRIGHAAREILAAHGCVIYVLEGSGRTLTPVVALGESCSDQILATPFPVSHSFTGQAVTARRGLIFNDAGANESGFAIPGTPTQEDERVIAVPFVDDQDVLGAMCLNRLGTGFSSEDLALAETFAAYATSALRNARSHDSLQREVQERRRAEEALRANSERLEERVAERTHELEEAQARLVRRERLAVLGQLAGGIGHELRNPLATIKGAAQFLQMTLQNPDENTASMLRILDDQVDYCTRIIHSLLRFAQPGKPTWHVVDLRRLLRASVARHVVSDTIEVVIRFDAPASEVIADPTQLEVIFGNLIRNAVQAMPDGGRLTITTACDKDDGDIVISVSDTGKGMSAEQREQIFEPLYTTKSQGIGLGLALVKLLVDGHGGRIWVESEVGRGAIFSVALPVQQEVKSREEES